MTRTNSTRATLLTTLPVLLFVLLTSVLPICFLLSNAFSESGTALDQGGGWSLENFREIFYDSYYVGRMLYTVALVVLVSILTLMVAMPLTIIIARLKNFWRSTWVVLLLTSLALSEVLTAYAWQIILSKSSGLPGWLERLGLLTDANSWWPGFPSYVTCPGLFLDSHCNGHAAAASQPYGWVSFRYRSHDGVLENRGLLESYVTSSAQTDISNRAALVSLEQWRVCHLSTTRPSFGLDVFGLYCRFHAQF